MHTPRLVGESVESADSFRSVATKNPISSDDGRGICSRSGSKRNTHRSVSGNDYGIYKEEKSNMI